MARLKGAKVAVKKDGPMLAKIAGEYYVNKITNKLNKEFTTSEGSW